MRRARRTGLGLGHPGSVPLGIAAFMMVIAAGCGTSERANGAGKSDAQTRAARRAFDGAPPTIPHGDFGGACGECHGERGIQVAGVGFSPPSPHEATQGLSALSRCRQCHVEQAALREGRLQEDGGRRPGDTEVFRGNTFAGLRQDLRHGNRLFDGAPPVMPHAIFMRENCTACHSGPAAREEIRTSHPERTRCVQCHAQQQTTDIFGRSE